MCGIVGDTAPESDGINPGGALPFCLMDGTAEEDGVELPALCGGCGGCRPGGWGTGLAPWGGPTGGIDPLGKDPPGRLGHCGW